MVRSIKKKIFYWISFPGCYIAFLFLLLKKKRGEVFVLLNMSLGDALYSLSFHNALFEKYKKEGKKLIYVVTDKHKTLLKCFGIPSENIMFLPHMGGRQLLVECLCHPPRCFSVGKYAFEYDILYALPNACDWARSSAEMGNRKLLSLIYGVSENLLDFPQISELPIISIEGFIEKKERICVINPYSDSMNIPWSIFEDLCHELLLKGYYVYTNVIGNQRVLKGSLALRCSVYELYNIAREIPLVVSVRSGILDLVVSTNVNIFALYSSRTYDEAWITKHYSLSEWNSKGLVEECLVDDDVLGRFRNFLDNLVKK